MGPVTNLITTHPDTCKSEEILNDYKSRGLMLMPLSSTPFHEWPYLHCMPQGNVHANMGSAHIRTRAVYPPVHVRGGTTLARSGPTTDMNGRVDGANANVGGAHWGLCPLAHFPVCV